jgi:hypothetical protein
MSVGGGQQAVVTDFDEAFGQDVLKEAADKLFGGDGRESGPICGRVLVGECDLAIFEREDAAIADGNAKDVRSEVFEGGLARAYGLRVNDPIFAPNLRVKEMEEIGLFEQVSELGAEQDRERGRFVIFWLTWSMTAMSRHTIELLIDCSKQARPIQHRIDGAASAMLSRCPCR